MVKFESDRILFVGDMAGALVFAMEGANTAINWDLDLLGMMVLAFATALGGGLVRDLLIGDVPPMCLRKWRYAAVAFSGAAIIFFLHHLVTKIPPNLILVLDTAGLSLFAIAGTEKALLHNMHPFIAVLLGTVTAVGGGTIRDLFLARIPRVLVTDVYATAALVGAVVMVLGRKVRLSPALAALCGGAVCFLLRVISVWQHWNLPKVSSH